MRRGSRIRRDYILWDHDGVLVDSERWYFVATRHVLGELGVDMDQATYLEFMAQGRSCWDFARERGVPEAHVDECRTRRDAIYQDLLASNDIAVPGVRDVLEELGRDHCMAVVSTARRDDLEWIHRADDMLDAFEFVIVREDCRHAKPHPEPYLRALKRFGAPADRAVAIEDSSRGLQSAVGAGIECLVVPTEFTASQDFTGATMVLGGLDELPGVLSA